MCLPAFNVLDVLAFQLITDDNPMPSINNQCEVPKILYGYRIVSSCQEAPPLFTVNGYPNEITQFIYHEVEVGKWILRPQLAVNQINEFNNIDVTECFYIQIIRTVTGCNEDYPEFGTPFSYTSSVVGCIGCFVKIANPCYTSLISYENKENAFGFYYRNLSMGSTGGVMSVRLPFYLKQPQISSKKSIFVKSNGEQVKLSARLEMEYNAETDYMPKEWHEKLVVALEHDFVEISNDNSNENSKFLHDGNYDIEWQDFLNHPTAKAKFKVKKTPYNKYNSNCNG
jgi:hypothetical protein